MKKNLKDYTGQRFGELEVIKQMEPKPDDKYIMWLCYCDVCGEYYVKSGMQLRGGAKSCGCLNKIKSRERSRKYNAARKQSREEMPEDNKQWDKEQSREEMPEDNKQWDTDRRWEEMAKNKKRREKNRKPLAPETEDDLFNLKYYCPYPIPQCRKSVSGTCCWDCSAFERCPNVCKNSPLKCGWKDMEKMYKNKLKGV